MMFGFINRVSPALSLKQGLDASTERTRAIADRVAKSTMGGADGFALPGGANAAATARANGVDLEQEMTNLADEQLHFEATARLLQKTYEQLRTSMRDR
jgi:hypothetical protein